MRKRSNGVNSISVIQQTCWAANLVTINPYVIITGRWSNLNDNHVVDEVSWRGHSAIAPPFAISQRVRYGRICGCHCGGIPGLGHICAQGIIASHVAPNKPFPN